MFERMKQIRKESVWNVGGLIAGAFAMVIAIALAMPLQVCAGNVTSGTLGDHNGVQWTYDADTKTLTVTGEDSGVVYNWQSPFGVICSDVEKITVENCVIHGSAVYLFAGLKNVVEIEFDNFDTSNVHEIDGMFSGCSSLTELDVSNFDTGNVTDMSAMFSSCSSLMELDLSNFDTSNVIGMGSMFYGCSSLTELNLSSFDTGNVMDMNDMFSGCSSLTKLDLNNFDTSKSAGSICDVFGSMFDGCDNLKELDIRNFTLSGSVNSMFSEHINLKSLDMSNCNTSNVSDMTGMFSGCSSLEELDLSSFDTGNVTSMWSMFYGCSSLKELDLSNFDTGNVTDMYRMFSGCSSLTELCVSNFDTGNVTIMDQMFSGCSSLMELDVSNFDTSNVTDMGWMFSGCSSLIELDVSNFNTSNITNNGWGMWGMFSDCSSLTKLDLSSFDTGNVTYMAEMFSGCSNLKELDLSSFDTSNATDVYYLFSKCWHLAKLYTPNTMSAEQSTFLPGEFKDSEQNVTSVLTADFCNDILTREIIAAEGISLSETSVTLAEGDSYWLTATITPENATIHKVNWSSSDEAVVTVGYGYITAKAPGEVIITATSVDNPDIYATCTVTVIEKDVPIEEITLSTTNLTLAVEDSYLLTATITPENASNKEVIWSTSDESVVTVSEGLIQAKAPSSVVITVTSVENPDIFATCEVKVVNPFADVPHDKWFYTFVKQAYDKGIMAGTGKTADGLIKFDPEGKVTREQFVQILYNMEGKPAVEYQNIFSDVPEQSGSVWYSNAVMWAVENGITSGYPNGRFGVGDPITREQVALMLLKYANIKGYDTTQRVSVAELQQNFSDVDDIDSWALDGMCWAVANGVMKGTAGGKLMPLGNATRAEAATMFLNMLRAYGE